MMRTHRQSRMRCSDALVALMSSQIMASMNKAPNEVRAGVAGRIDRDRCGSVLMKSRGCSLKRDPKVPPRQRPVTRDPFCHSMKAAHSCLSRGDSRQFGNCSSRNGAGIFLAERIVKHLRTRRRCAGSVAEALKNKARVNMQKSCGFRGYRVTKVALYHSLGRQPDTQLICIFYN